MDSTALAVIALGLEALIILLWVRVLLHRIERLEAMLRAPRPITLDGHSTIPRITFTGTGDLPLSIGVDTMRWNGEPFPFVTQGPIHLEFSDENAVIATVRIPLAMVDTLGPILAPAGGGKVTVPEEAHT